MVSVAATLPPNLLCHIFSVTPPPPPYKVSGDLRFKGPVLSFEERIQAESVNKHWRAILSSDAGMYQSLRLIPAEGSQDKVVHRALAIAARVPDVRCICVDVGCTDVVTSAVEAALHALLSKPGGDRTLRVALHVDSHLPRWLAIAAHHASLACLQVELPHSLSVGGHTSVCTPATWVKGELHLETSPLLPRLPHVRKLEVYAGNNEDVYVSLSSPQLEAATVHPGNSPWGALPPNTVVVGSAESGSGSGSSMPLGRQPQLPAFPLLRHLNLAAKRLQLDGAALSCLEEMRVALFSPGAELSIGSISALTRLSSLTLAADLDGWALREMGRDNIPLLTEDEDESEDEGYYGVFRTAHAHRLRARPSADSNSHSNIFAGLLAGTAPSLRRLSLTLTEPLDGAMSLALQQLVHLTHLSLRLGDPNRARAARSPAPASLDCQLLAGMTGLQELCLSTVLQPFAHSLDFGDLRCLSGLRRLCLDSAAPLSTLAQSGPLALTCLELPNTRAAELSLEQACALGSLPELERLVFEQAWHGYGSEQQRVAALAVHCKSVQLLAQCLPRGCEVLAGAPVLLGHR